MPLDRVVASHGLPRTMAALVFINMPSDPKPGATLHPLGPIVYRVAASRVLRARLIAGAVFVGCVLLLVTAGRITPDRSGRGTHRQLGLPPCALLMVTGYPCPTCGMTTAFSNSVRGRLGAAFRANPAGLVLALSTMVCAAVSLGVVLTGRVWVINWYRLPPTRLIIAVLVLILGGWTYKLLTGVLSGALPLR